MSTRKRGFEVVADAFRKFPNEEIKLPTRGSKYSAGYDFYSNEEITLQPDSKYVFWSDVKAYMQEGEVLKLYPRSSVGIKKDLALANSTGIIDMDYYQNVDNDGVIGICLRNLSKTNAVTITKGERIVQGIFLEFLVADGDVTDKKRTGGIGSTN